MNLGENIYRFRTQRNMSQGDLAEALEVSRQSVSKWENNSATPELEKLMKMSEVFGVTLDQLVGRESVQNPVPAAPEIIVRSGISPRQVVGIVLLSIGLVGFLALTLWAGFFMSTLCALPLIIIGTVLLTSGTNLFFKCCWALFAVYAPLAYFFILNFIRYGGHFSIGFVVVWFAIMIIWSIVLIRKGKLSAGSKKLMVGAIIFALIFAMVMGVANMVLYQKSGLHSIHEEIEEYSVQMD